VGNWHHPDSTATSSPTVLGGKLQEVVDMMAIERERERERESKKKREREREKKRERERES
jgi:hypothetical protein